ncbi:hypothetical protein KBC85_01540 [Candidatus Saccharibacteria bacterium]|nr:hypothetical protein [Candidatus Saccharibacteria bacterium]
MIQKILKSKSTQINSLYVLLLCLFILFLHSDPLFAEGLIPPSATTEQYTDADINGNPIILWIQFFINWISVFIVIGSVIAIAAAGVQYSAAAGDSGKIAEAKKRITNVLMALLAYFFLFAFIQWLVPGGII